MQVMLQGYCCASALQAGKGTARYNTDLTCLPARMTAFCFTFACQGSKAHVVISKEIAKEVLIMGVVVDCNDVTNT